MIRENLYIELWTNLLPKIKEVLFKSDEDQSIELRREWFDAAGDRKSYSFRLDIQQGAVTNNINGSAVARDLYKVLSNDREAKKLLSNCNVAMRLDRRFVFHVVLNP